jgi:hypothetical protein
MHARRSRSESEDAANGAPKLQRGFRTHNNVHASALGFHELEHTTVNWTGMR